MNFFNIGPMELLLILVLALIIFGPGKLPEVAKGLGKAISEFRKASQDLTSGIARELDTTAEALKDIEESVELPAQSKEPAEAPEQSKEPAEAAEESKEPGEAMAKDVSQECASKAEQSDN